MQPPTPQLHPFPPSHDNTLTTCVHYKTSPQISSVPMEEKEDLWVRLGRPRFVVAPMVDASELAWRMLSRRHGAHLCYTPMFHAVNFVKDPKYRAESLITIAQDRPLIVQFCGNDAEALLEAGLLAQSHCDAIDINLGCPQAIAKRGRYGAFLQDDWHLLAQIVSTLNKGLSVPVTCKVRVFESIEKTVAYAKMLEEAGCQMLTVHGRTREQKGPLTGIASWEHIKAVRESVGIPVLANGNIQCLTDVERCLRETGCRGVMSAEGSLYNPAVFEGRNPPCWEMATEYLNLVDQYPCPRSFIRGHMFKIFHHCLSLEENSDVRELLGKAACMDEFRNVVEIFKSRYLRIHEGELPWNITYTDYNLDLPPWLCKSYVRIPPEEHIKKLVEKVNRNADVMFDHKENQDVLIGKRPSDSTENGLSKKKLKKLQRRERSSRPTNNVRREIVMCQNDCKNPMGQKCSFFLCKTCCRIKCYVDHEDCAGHGILTKTRREKARKYQMDVTDDDRITTTNFNEKPTVQTQQMDESW